jgi:hypothetical protein
MKQERQKRKSPAGVATNDLVFSGHVGPNDEVFPQVLRLYVPEGSTVADVTYGKRNCEMRNAKCELIGVRSPESGVRSIRNSQSFD